MNGRVFIIRCIILLALLSLVGCGSSSPKVNYYRLTTHDGLNVNDQPIVSGGDISVAIGPVSIADSLKRPQLVTRKANGQLHFASTEHWAGQLEREIQTALIHNLSFLLNTERVSTYADTLRIEPEFQVIITFERFEGGSENEADLTARWSVISHDQKTAALVKRTAIKVSLATKSYPALVQAESRALYRFSHEIATALATQHSGKPTR